jgi:hypothetical protein
MSTRKSQEGKEAQHEPIAVQEQLNWRLAWRDDAQVAQALYAGEEIEEIHELSEAGLLDEFFVFLKELYASKMIMRSERVTVEHRDPCLGQTDCRYVAGPLPASGPAPENASPHRQAEAQTCYDDDYASRSVARHGRRHSMRLASGS